MTDARAEDLNRYAHDDRRRAHIPPEIRAANRRRAVELEARDADKPNPPAFAHWMRTVFVPEYRKMLAEGHNRADANSGNPPLGSP